jgi:two-component system, NarL family, invasion response regulator UvrY
MPRILLVDSQPVLRKGLKTTLGESIAGCVFSEAGCGHDAIRMLPEQLWDLVITQIALPDVHWVDLIRRIKLKAPKTPLLVFCRYPEEQYGTRCIKLGAAGYLSKTVEVDELVEAVKRILVTGKFISPKVGEQFAVEATGQHVGAEPHDTLSNREYEIFRMLTSGLTCTQIAENLNLSIKTVSTYRKRILSKMGMQSNADLTHYAVSIGLMY